jgi:Na+-translocating ferredoxin:NAD+ oxidoreductase RNF subunit RnfB
MVEGSALPGKCTVINEDEREYIAAFLGVDVGAEEKVVARLACAGGLNVARNRAHYEGLRSCRAAALVAGGGKGCFWGCLGLGDCEVVCDLDAIVMDEHDLPVVIEDACTACGDCVDACPKDLFSLHPVSHRLWVACKNLQKGDAALAECEVACDACGKCAVDAPAGVITMKDNLPVVDYDRNHNVRKAIERCPTGAIVWFDPENRPVTGRAARKVVRQGARHVAPT